MHVPTLVVYGGTSHPAMQRCSQVLASHLPCARIVALETANHFMVGSHAAALADMLDGHFGGRRAEI